MHSIQLSDHVYLRAQQRATEAGFPTVDEYVTEIVESELVSATNLDHLFTAEILAQLDQIHVEVQGGAKTYSSCDVDEHFQRKSQAWREAHCE